jgi:hypothetical protein
VALALVGLVAAMIAAKFGLRYSGLGSLYPNHETLFLAWTLAATRVFPFVDQEEDIGDLVWFPLQSLAVGAAVGFVLLGVGSVLASNTWSMGSAAIGLAVLFQWAELRRDRLKYRNLRELSLLHGTLRSTHQSGGLDSTGGVDSLFVVHRPYNWLGWFPIVVGGVLYRQELKRRKVPKEAGTGSSICK